MERVCELYTDFIYKHILHNTDRREVEGSTDVRDGEGEAAGRRRMRVGLVTQHRL